MENRNWLKLNIYSVEEPENSSWIRTDMSDVLVVFSHLFQVGVKNLPHYV